MAQSISSFWPLPTPAATSPNSTKSLANCRRSSGKGSRDDGRCSLIFRPTAAWDQIYHDMTTQPDDIAIFHFGGHANEGQVLLDSHLGATAVESKGLASLLRAQAELETGVPQRLLDPAAGPTPARCRRAGGYRYCETDRRSRRMRRRGGFL